MKPSQKRALYYALAAVAVCLVIFFVWHGAQRKNDPHYVTAQVQYGDINATIQETGTVNPVDEVDVGTQVSGTISQLFVDYNSIVHEGEVLAKLDPTSFQAAANQASASLDMARAQAAAGTSTVAQNAANTQNMVANEQQLVANVKKAQAQEALSNITVQRDRQLIAEGYISQSQLDTDIATENSNLEALRAAQQQAKGGTAQVVGANATEQASQSQAVAAQANIEVAAAQAEQANYDLSRTVITSPINGIVVSRAVSVGETVAASLQTPTLFVIASSLKDMEVDVSVDEADVGQLRDGQTAYITVPAYPNVEFKGIVKQVRVNPTSVANVVTYDAVVIVHDDQQRLLPGMTANVTIDVVHRPNVLTVPLAALLYRPSNQHAHSSGSAGSSGASGSSAGASSAATPAPVAGAPGSQVTLWTLQRNKPVAAPVVIGYSDGNNVEIESGSLKAGDVVITGEIRSSTTRTTSPAFGGGFGGRG
ncbi:MAG TPA: efflux RND transporter periplasmic adaptor subunit [Candidatus Acidoferrales bacterium]|nr:efflux RND transporter periplasmic adaptor subunit [Candidatus Acidoferrales bacterium]